MISFTSIKQLCSCLGTEVVIPEIDRNMTNPVCMYIPSAQG